MISSIFAALSAIKEIISTVKAIMDFVEANRNETWWREWSQTREQLKNAKTTDERKALAKSLRDSLFGI